MNQNEVTIYVNNKEKNVPKNMILTWSYIVELAKKDPNKSSVQFKKNHGEGHSYEAFEKDMTIEAKNHMSFKVIEDIDNGQKN